jgi:zinc protease
MRAASLRRGILVFAFVAFLTRGNAQEPDNVLRDPGSSGEDFKHQAPFSADIVSIQTPHVASLRLSGGAALLVIVDRRVPLVHLELRILRAGGVFEPPYARGLAAAALELAFAQDSATRSGGSDPLDRYGVKVYTQADCDDQDATIYISGLSELAHEWLPLVVTSVAKSTYPDTALTNYKQRRKAALVADRQSPSFAASAALQSALLGSYPGALIEPSAEAIDGYSVGMLKRWSAEHFVPSRMILAVTGDISAAHASRLVNGALGRRSQTAPGSETPPMASPQSIQTSGPIYIHREHSSQASIQTGGVCPRRSDPDYLPLTVLCSAIGSGPSSRLYAKLRNNLGIAYNIGFSISGKQAPGIWKFSAEVKGDAVERALAAIHDELGRASSDGLPEKELLGAKRTLIASQAFQLERPMILLNEYLDDLTSAMPRVQCGSGMANISNVSRTDILRVARKYFCNHCVQDVVLAANRPSVSPPEANQ